MTLRKLLAFVALSFLWTGSQIPIYLFGAIPPYIYADIGGADRWTWMTLANILALASVCPFVGSLSDMFGRRYIALAGASLVILGMVCRPYHQHQHQALLMPHHDHLILLNQYNTDHRRHRPDHEHSHWRSRLCRCWRRYQRAHRPRCRL